MLAAGTEPPTNLLSKAIVALLTHPDQRRMLDRGEVSWSRVIEETLRVEAPVAHLPYRFTVEDVEIGGVTIPKGDPVLIGFAGAGRDPAVYGDPLTSSTRPGPTRLTCPSDSAPTGASAPLSPRSRRRSRFPPCSDGSPR
jgi:hypothetical protein